MQKMPFRKKLDIPVAAFTRRPYCRSRVIRHIWAGIGRSGHVTVSGPHELRE